jgi:hypothetical protein
MEAIQLSELRVGDVIAPLLGEGTMEVQAIEPRATPQSTSQGPRGGL